MSAYRRSYSRRTMGLLVAAVPFALACSSLVADSNPFFPTIGLILVGVAILIAALNFWLSFLGPFLWERRHGSMKEYQNISGLPAIGTLLAMAACLVAFGAAITAVLALIVMFVDTGGLPWFVFFTWRDESLWDTENPNGSKQGAAPKP